MVIQIYAPPVSELALYEHKLGDINDAISLEYEMFFCGVGTFTLELPLTTPFAEQLYENNLLYLRDDDVCFIIKNVKHTSDKIIVVGYDLNGMLLDRLTMERDSGVAGTEGKDCISGTTEACVKHFVNYNMIASPDIFRNYPRFAVADDLGRGNAQDSDLVGKEIVEDVVRTLCEGAELGYRVKLRLHDSVTQPILVFDVYEREDHTADQSERNRVIFSEGLQNITEIERETGITAEKNALWCDTGGENMFVYKTFKNGEPFNPVGWDRREEYISLSVTNNYDTAEIEQTARKQMADKFAMTDSLVIDAGNPLDYGTIYKLGDIVTVYDKKRSLQLNSVISSVLVKRSGTEHSVQISLGERKPKLLDKYAKQSQIQRKEQTDFPPTLPDSGSLSPLVSYAYLTDTSTRFNGTTYTAEKDASGLITKITDSKSGVFSPEVSGEITDVAFHNAVFMAVAMVCGLGKTDNTLVLYDEGDECSDITGGWRLWHNANATATKIKYDDYMYIHSENTGTQYAFVLANTYAPIDLTKYTKLHFEVIAPTTNESVYSDYGISVDEPNDTWSNITQSGFFGRFDERTDIVMDITDRSGLYYVNLLVDRGNELKIYKVWLEK